MTAKAPISSLTERFINLLMHMGFSPQDIMDGMDDALDGFEESYQEFKV